MLKFWLKMQVNAEYILLTETIATVFSLYNKISTDMSFLNMKRQQFANILFLLEIHEHQNIIPYYCLLKILKK